MYNEKQLKLIKDMQDRYIDIIRQSFDACIDCSSQFEVEVGKNKYIKKSSYLLHLRGLRQQVLNHLKRSLVETNIKGESDVTKH